MVRTLCEFIRYRSRLEREARAERARAGEAPKPADGRLDIEAAMEEIGRRRPRSDRHAAGGLNLRGAYLPAMELTAFDLRRADLRGAFFEGARLHSAHLEWADLSGAILERTILVGAGLQGAGLEGAHLEGARLYWALLHVDWKTRPETPPTRFVGAHLEGVDLAGALLAGVDLTAAHLEGVDLRGAILARAKLSGAHLEGADLSGADLEPVWPRDGQLEGDEPVGAYLMRADLRGATRDAYTTFPDGFDWRGAGVVWPFGTEVWQRRAAAHPGAGAARLTSLEAFLRLRRAGGLCLRQTRETIAELALTLLRD